MAEINVVRPTNRLRRRIDILIEDIDMELKWNDAWVQVEFKKPIAK